MTPRGRPGVAAGVLRLLPRHLAVAWFAVAPLYFVGPRGLPSPPVAFGVSTAVAVVAAIVSGPVRRHKPVGIPGRTSMTPPLALAMTQVRQASAPVTVDPVVGQARVDLRRYRAADSNEVQCPRCGGFAVSVRPRMEQEISATCATCGLHWPMDPSAPTPDVVVRSWLHR